MTTEIQFYGCFVQKGAIDEKSFINIEESISKVVFKRDNYNNRNREVGENDGRKWA